MIAENHPLVVGGAVQRGDHVVERALGVIHYHFHVNCVLPAPPTR